MPYYDLKCKECSKEFNVKASMKEREEKSIHCPSCGSSRLDPVFNSINIIRSKNSSTPSCPSCCSGGSCPL